MSRNVRLVICAALCAVLIVATTVATAPWWAPEITARYSPLPGQVLAVAERNDKKPGSDPGVAQAVEDRFSRADPALAEATLTAAVSGDPSAARLLRGIPNDRLGKGWPLRLGEGVDRAPREDVRLDLLRSLAADRPDKVERTAPVAALIRRLASGGKWERSLAVQALAFAADAGDDAAITALIEALADREEVVRLAAVRSLWKASDPRILPALMAITNDTGEMIAGLALEQIAGRLKNGAPGTADLSALAAAIVKNLGDDDVRGNALHGMSAASSFYPYTNADAVPPGLVSALRTALDDGDYQRRQMAASLLRFLDPEPSLRLAEVTIEGLADDAAFWDRPIPSPSGNRVPYTPLCNAAEGQRWLIANPGHCPNRLLAAALDSADDQQRLLAADALAYRADGDDPLLTPVLVDFLSPQQTSEFRPMQTAFAALCRYAARDQAVLEANLEDALIQRRFGCAVLLAFNRRSDLSPRIAPILLPHLRDNHLEGDAALAVRGLFLLGQAAEPMLRAALPTADPQQRSLIEMILRDWADPPTSAWKAQQRMIAHQTPRVGNLVYDGAIEDRYEKLGRFPSGQWR
ncbi:hypothetical protein LBMAG53_18040 [Planctomycetota bacterium]|nr:hypothetical protein LBMAG53_18040 [Planctomycetota bacterium]